MKEKNAHRRMMQRKQKKNHRRQLSFLDKVRLFSGLPVFI